MEDKKVFIEMSITEWIMLASCIQATLSYYEKFKSFIKDESEFDGETEMTNYYLKNLYDNFTNSFSFTCIELEISEDEINKSNILGNHLTKNIISTIKKLDRLNEELGKIKILIDMKKELGFIPSKDA